uniref:Embryonic flower 1-like protein n=1 Tax=Setaria italica TaxID=4555 RepID=K3XE32_SETIT
MRGYVALHQKKDPKLCSLRIFCNQQQYDEHNNNSSPLLVAKYQRWNCSNCLDRVKNSGHRTTSETVPMQQDGTNDDCSISIIRTLPYSVGSRRLFSCTRQSSQGNDADQSNVSKSVQECNSKCSSPSDNKAVTAVNVPATSAENNVPDTFVEKSIPDTKDLQGSPNNLVVQEDILNDVSMDITDLPDDPQMISSKEGNGTQIPCSPKPCEVPTEDENRTVQDVPDVDCNESSVHEPVSGHKGSKSSSGQKSNQVRNQGPRRAAPKRNVGSDDLKFSQRKPKKTRLISEIINTKTESSADDTEADHAKTGDICESDKSKMPLEAGKDNDTPVSNQKVCEIQSTAVKNKAELRGLENVDDGSSLMNWLKKTHKKVRTEKRDSAHKNFGSSAVSNSNPDMPASSDMCHDSIPSVGDLGQENVLSTTSAKHRNENTQNKNMEQNMQKADDLCRNESEKLKRRFLSNGKSPILLKRKVLSPAISCDKNTENSTIKRSMLRTDDLCQVESEGTVQRCLAKVSLGKGKIQNVSGLHKQNIPKNKKKRRLEVHEKQTVIDDIPMDIVELLARNQHERQLMTDTDSTLPKIAAVDCAEIADKYGPTDASTVLDTNFQKSLASESKQKSLQGRASSSTEAANVLLQDLHRQKSSQCHAASSTEIPNSHRPELHMQNSLQVHALPITGSFNVYPPELRMPDILECTQEQQTDICRDEEVTIACTSPIFSHHQHIAEVPTQSWSKKGEKKLMWDSFKTASRNSPTSTYGFQFRNRIREVDSTPIPAYGASNDYATHQPVIAAVDQYTKEAVNQVQPRSAPSTSLTMEVGRPYDHRIAGHSGLYPKEPMPATHLLRLMDSSTSQGFTNYQRANRRQIELRTQNLSSQYAQHNHYNASPSTSHGSHLTEKVPLTLQDLARHQVEKNLHRPLRPHPRVGVLGSLLQQDIANWSESCGTQSGHRLGVSKGTTSFDMNRTGNYETLSSGMFSAGWNALQLGSGTSAANPEHPLPRYGVSQPWAGGTGKTPLDKLVRKDICQTNRNPADFTVISDKNEYMINL